MQLSIDMPLCPSGCDISHETNWVSPTDAKQLIIQLKAHPPARAQNVMVVIGIASAGGHDLTSMRDAMAEVLEGHFLVSVTSPVRLYRSTVYANCHSVLMNFLGIACGARTIDQAAAVGKPARFNDNLKVGGMLGHAMPHCFHSPTDVGTCGCHCIRIECDAMHAHRRALKGVPF